MAQSPERSQPCCPTGPLISPTATEVPPIPTATAAVIRRRRRLLRTPLRSADLRQPGPLSQQGYTASASAPTWRAKTRLRVQRSASNTYGGYETYVSREIVDYLDANFRTLAQPASRGITGCSMGGDGAAHLGLAHPDIFGVVAAVAGGGYHRGEPGWTELGAGYGKATSINEFRTFPMFVRIGISLAAAAAPNPNSPPFYTDEPWTIVDGKVQAVPEVVAKLDAKDPMDDAKRYAEQPLRLNAFMFIMAGKTPCLAKRSCGHPPARLRASTRRARQTFAHAPGMAAGIV
ncbi:MAG: alpha/beta hydrolase-fold protein [Nitrososphaerales archaeon]